MDEKTEFEKMTEGVFQLALLLNKYYEALKQEGVPEELAHKLVVAYQGYILGIANPNNKKEIQ